MANGFIWTGSSGPGPLYPEVVSGLGLSKFGKLGTLVRRRRPGDWLSVLRVRSGSECLSSSHRRLNKVQDRFRRTGVQ